MFIALDEVIARHPDPKPSRPEMIRRALASHFVEDGLGAADTSRYRETG